MEKSSDNDKGNRRQVKYARILQAWSKSKTENIQKDSIETINDLYEIASDVCMHKLATVMWEIPFSKDYKIGQKNIIIQAKKQYMVL
jgi:hypothetical protein